MRSREFIQADVDVIGSSEISSEAEVIAASAIALENLGITDYTILLNEEEYKAELKIRVMDTSISQLHKEFVKWLKSATKKK